MIAKPDGWKPNGMVGGTRNPKWMDSFDLQSEIVHRREMVEWWATHLMQAIEKKDTKEYRNCYQGMYQHHARLRHLWQEHERRAGRTYTLITGDSRAISERVIVRLRREYAERDPKPTFVYLAAKYGMHKSYARRLVAKEARATIAS